MFIRLLKYSVKNILRNKFLSISSILVLTLLMFFINILLVMHNVSFKLIDSINSKMTISLYLEEGYDKNSAGVIDLINGIKKLSKDLVVDYKSKDQVLEEIKTQDENLVKILERSNPLPNTIIISSIPLREYSNLNYLIESKLYLFGEDLADTGENKNSQIATYKAQYERINKVISVLQTLGLGLYVIIATFLVSIGIIIYSIIGNFIYYYKDEIYITRLVGGSRVFIYGPFSLQGAIYSIISFFISIAIFSIMLENVSFIFGETYTLDFLLKNANIILPLELLLFILIGGLSGYFSSRKYLK
ncbi:MAG: hypothetical protein PHH06_03175 [Candidatus Gracilibacteria bacterium]|nr:hypothetical protein [Candidatus Gracilibacteria bacterium]